MGGGGTVVWGRCRDVGGGAGPGLRPRGPAGQTPRSPHCAVETKWRRAAVGPRWGGGRCARSRPARGVGGLREGARWGSGRRGRLAPLLPAAGSRGRFCSVACACKWRRLLAWGPSLDLLLVLPSPPPRGWMQPPPRRGEPSATGRRLRGGTCVALPAHAVSGGRGTCMRQAQKHTRMPAPGTDVRVVGEGPLGVPSAGGGCSPPRLSAATAPLGLFHTSALEAGHLASLGDLCFCCVRGGCKGRRPVRGLQ